MKCTRKQSVLCKNYLVGVQKKRKGLLLLKRLPFLQLGQFLLRGAQFRQQSLLKVQKKPLLGIKYLNFLPRYNPTLLTAEDFQQVNKELKRLAKTKSLSGARELERTLRYA